MSSYWRVMVAGAHDRASEHRPRSRDEMRLAVHELAIRGYSPPTIAVACRIAVEQVRQLLGEPAP